MNDGIEKLQKYAFGMKPRRCDDILVLADQIQREHVSELQALEERYHTNLRDAREARDIAIKEATEYKHQLGDIIEYLGVASWKKPVLSSKDGYGRIMSELDKRLMPKGMEWPRFEDGMKIACDDAPEDIAAVCIALDGSCYSLHYDMPDDERMCIYEVSESVKRHGAEVLGADGLPIKVGDTVYGAGREPGVYTVVLLHAGEGRFFVECEDRDGARCMVDASMVSHTQPDTQERIDAAIISGYRDRICPQFEPYTREYCTNECDCNSCLAERIMEQCDRQRELDARTMGGE